LTKLESDEVYCGNKQMTQSQMMLEDYHGAGWTIQEKSIQWCWM